MWEREWERVTDGDRVRGREMGIEGESECV